MKHSTHAVALSAAATLVLAACGSDGEQNVAPPPTADTLAPITTDDAPNGAVQSGQVPLGAALAQTRDAEAYHVDMAIGFDMDLGMGVPITIEADIEQPLVRMDVDADEEVHAIFDLGSMMEPMAASAPGAGSADLPNEMVMEYWISGTEIRLDMSGAPLLAAQLQGPLAAAADGPFTIDLAELDAVGGLDVAGQLTGQSMPQPSAVADALIPALGDSAEQVEPGHFRGTVSLGDLTAAFGTGSPFGPAGSALDGFVADPDKAAAAMEELLSGLTADVDITLDGETVDLLRLDVDLTALFADLPALAESAGSPIPPEQVEFVEQMLADAAFAYSLVYDFDLDSTIDVEVPTGDVPDLTEEFLELLALGLGG